MPPPLTSSTTLDGLPKMFVTAMRKLFDIMDDRGTGFVKFSEIETRWLDDGTKGLPKGVIESLRKVTPPNGLLSFERFCAGLKICLLRNQVEGRAQSIHHHQQQPARPPSAPVEVGGQPTWSNTATVRPNNAAMVPQQRTLSMPQLGLYLGAPPKPPRTAAGLEQSRAVQQEQLRGGGSLDKQEIRTVLQNWQMALLVGDRSGGDGKPAGNAEQLNAQAVPHKKITARRREPRRHTLQNGIDYNMLKRMKQIEQEKDVLTQGLQAVERARDWYLKQIAAVQEKMKYLGRMGSHMVCQDMNLMFAKLSK